MGLEERLLATKERREHIEKREKTVRIWSREFTREPVREWTLYSKSSPAHRAGVTDPIVYFSIRGLPGCLHNKNNTNPAAHCVASRLVKISGQNSLSEVPLFPTAALRSFVVNFLTFSFPTFLGSEHNEKWHKP